MLTLLAHSIGVHFYPVWEDSMTTTVHISTTHGLTYLTTVTPSKHTHMNCIEHFGTAL